MNTEEETYQLIPYKKLSNEAFNSLVEEFILREGTDYGHSEDSLEEKKTRLMKQLKSGHLQIVFSSLTENCTLMTKAELSKYL